MNEIKIFSNPVFGEIRTITEGSTTLFCGSDVAKALGYANPTKAINDHCKAIVERRTNDSLGRQQNMKFISEGDIYRLAAKSELPGADEFERWIFDEVLPSIRKHGGYLAGQEAMTPDELMAKALIYADSKIKEYSARISALTVENQIMQPKAEYFDQLIDRNLLTNLRDTAKELEVKEKAFIRFLLDKKYLYRDKRGSLCAYAQHVGDDGLFAVKECFNEKTSWKGTQTMVTPKGRETFRLLMKGA